MLHGTLDIVLHGTWDIGLHGTWDTVLHGTWDTVLHGKRDTVLHDTNIAIGLSLHINACLTLAWHLIVNTISNYSKRFCQCKGV